MTRGAGVKSAEHRAALAASADRYWEPRFWAQVDKTGDCWLWTGRVNAAGYGVARYHGQSLAHRAAYERVRGPIPGDLHLDHLCRTPRCVNPDHLEPVTIQENARRGTGFGGALRVPKDRCPQGHLFDEANSYRWGPGKANRQCLTCRRIRSREAYLRLRSATHGSS